LRFRKSFFQRSREQITANAGQSALWEPGLDPVCVFQVERRGTVIVERQEFRVKPGCLNEAVEVLQEMWKLVDPIPHRIYRTITGPFNTFYQELEFEDLQQREKWWIGTGEKIAPLMDKWNALNDTGGGSELLRLVE
jgi:hypothetical protein